jgi:uncharacterized membrane protein
MLIGIASMCSILCLVVDPPAYTIKPVSYTKAVGKIHEVPPPSELAPGDLEPVMTPRLIRFTSSLVDVNDNGDVLGTGVMLMPALSTEIEFPPPGPVQVNTVTVWLADGTRTTILNARQFPEDSTLFPVALNNKGQCVGYVTRKGSYYDRAFVWDGEMLHLSDESIDMRCLDITDDSTLLLVKWTDQKSSFHTSELLSLNVEDFEDIPVDSVGIPRQINTDGTILAPSGLWTGGQWLKFGTISATAMADDTYPQATIIGVTGVWSHTPYKFRIPAYTEELERGDYATATPFGINQNQIIVGRANENGYSWFGDAPSTPNRAVIWIGTQIHDLNLLIDPDLGWELESAHAINNDGAIVGVGKLNGVELGYLMEPIE